MRKGFVFTLFVFFTLALVLTTFSLQPPALFQDTSQQVDKVQTDEAFYLLSSIQSDLERASEIAGRRALSSLIQQALNGSAISNASENYTTLLLNGKFNATTTPLMEDSSLQEWKQRVTDLTQNQYTFDVNFTQFSITYNAFTLNVRFIANMLLEDAATPAVFRPQKTQNTEISIRQLEDPLIHLRTDGRVSHTFSQCNTTTHAQRMDTGNQTNIAEWVAAKTWTINNTSTALASIPKDRIAIAEEVCTYNQTQLNELEEFSAVASEAELDLDNQCEGNVSLDAVTGGITFEKIRNNTYSVLNGKEIWRVPLLQQVRSGCYFQTEEGPSVFDRIENKTTHTTLQGIGHFLNLEEMPQDLTFERSALDFVYFNPDPYGSINKIKGVTDHESWFRLDDTHVNRWNMTALTY